MIFTDSGSCRGQGPAVPGPRGWRPCRPPGPCRPAPAPGGPPGPRGRATAPGRRAVAAGSASVPRPRSRQPLCRAMSESMKCWRSFWPQVAAGMPRHMASDRVRPAGAPEGVELGEPPGEARAGRPGSGSRGRGAGRGPWGASRVQVPVQRPAAARAASTSKARRGQARAVGAAEGHQQLVHRQGLQRLAPGPGLERLAVHHDELGAAQDAAGAVLGLQGADLAPVHHLQGRHRPADALQEGLEQQVGLLVGVPLVLHQGHLERPQRLQLGLGGLPVVHQHHRGPRP